MSYSGDKRTFISIFSLAIFFVLLPSESEAALVARWKFDEGTGSTTVDSVNSISGTFIKGSSGGSAYPTWSTDLPSVSYTNPYSLSFAGLQDGIQISWPSDLNFTGTEPRSFSFWYKPTADGETAAGNYDRIMSWTSDRFEIAGTLGDVSVHRLAFYDGSWRDTEYNMSVGTWYNITFTYDGTNVKLYVDNTEKFSGTSDGRDLNGNMYIGVRWEINEGINGIIDDVKIYDHALTVAQISNLTAGSDNPDSAPDSTAPTVGLTVPSNNATVGNGNVTVTATSTDSVGVSGVKFYYDTNNQIGDEITSTSSPNTYTTTWSTSGVSEGSHTLIAVARDAAGNRATSTAINVTVDKTAPTFSNIASSTSSTGATLTWTTNEAASTKVVYSINTGYASTTSETDTSTRVTSHSKEITGLLSCTTYNFKVVSADSVNNYSTSTPKTFTTSGCAGGATPSSLATSTITVSSAATTTISDSGRSIQIVSPANFTDESSSIIIQIKGLSANTVLNSIGKPSNSLSSASSIAFNVTALIDNITEVGTFDTPVTITYTYTDADISGITESSLTMYHYDNSTWTELDDCSVNTESNTITCEASHFSVFAIFGTSSTSSGNSSSSSKGNGPVFKGSVSDLPGYIHPRSIKIFPDGRIVYLDENNLPTLPPKGSCPSYKFNRTLKLGMSGEDVLYLQKIMNCFGFTLANSGSGSPGNETNYFGTRTHSSVIRFQETYASSILAPLKLKKATGIFGDFSRKKIEDYFANLK